MSKALQGYHQPPCRVVVSTLANFDFESNNTQGLRRSFPFMHSWVINRIMCFQDKAVGNTGSRPWGSGFEYGKDFVIYHIILKSGYPRIAWTRKRVSPLFAVVDYYASRRSLQSIINQWLAWNSVTRRSEQWPRLRDFERKYAQEFLFVFDILSWESEITMTLFQVPVMPQSSMLCSTARNSTVELNRECSSLWLVFEILWR